MGVHCSRQEYNDPLRAGIDSAAHLEHITFLSDHRRRSTLRIRLMKQHLPGTGQLFEPCIFESAPTS